MRTCDVDGFKYYSECTHPLKRNKGQSDAIKTMKLVTFWRRVLTSQI